MTITSVSIENNEIHHYADFLQAIRHTFRANSKEPLFITDVPELWSLFLNQLPSEARQQHTCSTCRHFVENYGSLVTIDQDGNAHSVLWDAKTVPAFYQPAVKAMQQAVEQATVKQVFYSSLLIYGKPQTNHWQHMSVESAILWYARITNAGQQISKKREEFHMFNRALESFSTSTIDNAVKLLRSDQLYRSEKVLEIAEWFRKVHQRLHNTPNLKQRHNKQWLVVATAPQGFCHIRNSMLGTLLKDIEAGLDYEEISRNFAEKMNPLRYRRPQTAPHVQNITKAEKIIAELQAEQALERRFARLQDLKLMWQPDSQQETNIPAPTKGIFSHLITRNKRLPSQTMNLPPQTMTWEKFEHTVLPNALKVEYLIFDALQNYAAITTAVNPDAPPILQWDHLEQRNTCSSYLYHGGSKPQDWNLPLGYVEVTGMCINPAHWYKEMSHQHKGIILILKNAKDLRYQFSGSALFPETLKSEFHPIRKTIEAFSKSAQLQGFDEASACGLSITSGGALNHKLRVTTDLGTQEYVIDRWD